MLSSLWENFDNHFNQLSNFRLDRKSCSWSWVSPCVHLNSFLTWCYLNFPLVSLSLVNFWISKQDLFRRICKYQSVFGWSYYILQSTFMNCMAVHRIVLLWGLGDCAQKWVVSERVPQKDAISLQFTQEEIKSETCISMQNDVWETWELASWNMRACLVPWRKAPIDERKTQ